MHRWQFIDLHPVYFLIIFISFFANGFQAKAAGWGPVVSWMDKTGKYIAELKYLSDFENEKRLEGDTVWFKFITKF